MTNNDKKGGFDSVKSLLLSGATLGPIAIGLGLGVKNGFGSIKENKAIKDVLTGGRPNELEMIGRSVGKTRAGMSRDALRAARGVTNSGIQTSMDLFAAASQADGPQRNALYQAYTSMLNSKTLNMSETEIAEEAKFIGTKVNSPDFNETIISRIKKREMEVGQDQSKEFIGQMRRLYERNIEMEQGMKMTTNLQFKSKHPIIQIHERELENLTSKTIKQLGERGTEANQNYKALQQLLSEYNLSGKFKISDISAGGGRGVFAHVTLQGGAQFDMPLSLIRNKYMTTVAGEKAAGGLMVLRQGGRYSTQVAMGSAFDPEAGRILTGEQFAFKQLKSTLQQISKGQSSEYRRELFKQFHERTYSTQQIINPTAPEEMLAQAYRRTFLHEVPTSMIKDKSLLLDPAHKGLFSPYGVTSTALAGEKGMSYMYQADTPIGGVTRIGFDPTEMNMPVAARPQQWHRGNAIVRTNNPINIISSLGWTNLSQIGVKKYTGGPLKAYREAEAATQFSSVAIYQLKKKGVESTQDQYRFMQGLGLFEGTSVAGRVYGTFTNPSNVNVMLHARDRQSPILNELTSLFNESKTRGIYLTNKEIKNLLKKHGMKNLSLGYDASGMRVDLGWNSKLNAGLRIDAIEALKNKGGEYSGEVRLSVAMANKPGRYMKTHSESQKGLVVGARNFEGFLKRHTSLGPEVLEILRAQNPGIRSEDAMLVTTEKQLLRSGQAINEQIMTGTMLRLHEAGLTGSSLKRIGKSLMSQTESMTLARSAITEMEMAGVSSQKIASVVASQYFREGNETEAILGELTKGFKPGLGQAIKGTTEVFGATTMSIDPHEMGIGKPTRLERRSMNALMRHMQTLGEDIGMSSGDIQKYTTSMLANITARGANTLPGQELLSNRSLLASFRSMSGEDISPLTKYADELGLDLNIADKKLSQMTNKFRGSTSPFTGTTGVNLTFDTPESARMAKEVFGSEKIFVPGTRGLPNLGTLNIKKGKQNIAYASSYEQGLERMLRAAGDPNRAPEEVRTAMQAFKGEVAKGLEVAGESAIFGKIRGSAQATAQALNKLEFSPERYKRLAEIAKRDVTSQFMSDVIFFKSVAGLREGLAESSAEYQELIAKTKLWLFESTKLKRGLSDPTKLGVGEGVHGMFTRFPTLGEGHVRFWNARRAGTYKDTQAITEIGEVRKFMREKLGVRIKRSDPRMKDKYVRAMHGFMEGRVGPNDGATRRALQTQLSGILVQNAHKFMGGGSVYVPQIDGAINIVTNGQRQTVQHSFSAFLQMVGDTDADRINFIMGQGRDSTRFLNKAFRSDTGRTAAAEAMLAGEAEWIAIQKHIKGIQGGAVSGTQYENALARIAHQTELERAGKAVGGYSVGLDRLRVGLLAYGKDSNLQRQGLGLLAMLEEGLIKVSKKGGGAADIADQFAASMGVGRTSSPDFVRAREILEQFALGSQYKAQATINIENFMGQRNYTQSIEVDTKRIIDEMMDSTQELYEAKALNADKTKRLRNLLENQSYDPSVGRIVKSIEEGAHSFGWGAISAMGGGSQQATRASTIDLLAKAKRSMGDILSSKRTMIPIGLGVGAGLVALNVAAPGYSPKPLTAPDETLSMAGQRAIASGSLLSGMTNLVDGSNNYLNSQSNDLPVARNNLIESSIRVEDMDESRRAELTMSGIQNIPQAKQIISALGMRSNHIYLQDNRRPITKNYIDQLREE